MMFWFLFFMVEFVGILLTLIGIWKENDNLFTIGFLLIVAPAIYSFINDIIGYGYR